MKTMRIFEPAMCCPTGLCGVGVDPELLRICAVFDTLKKNGIDVERFNLSSAPMEFVTNVVVNEFIGEKGPDGLPVVLLDGRIVLSGRYPTNEELNRWLSLPQGLLRCEPAGAEPGGDSQCGCQPGESESGGDCQCGCQPSAASACAPEPEDTECGGDCCCKGGCC